MSNLVPIIQIEELIQLRNDKSKQLKSHEYLQSGLVPIVDQSMKKVCGYTNDVAKIYDKGLPVIIFGDHTLHTKFIDFDFAIGADGTQVIVPKSTDCDHKYLYYLIHRAAELIGSEGYKRHLKILKEFDIEYIDSLPEQRKIAAILSSVDDVIEKTQAQIDKLKDLKTGMMQELLTKGVCDEHGKRYTEFKDSPVGRIPVGWDVLPLSEACSMIRDGTHLPPKRVPEGVPLLSVRNMKDGRFTLLDDDTYVSEDFYEKMHVKWKPEGGDLLLAVVGATVGKVCQVPENFPKFTLQRSVAVLRGRENLLDGDFLYAYSQSKPFNDRLWDRVNQTAQPGIYLAEIGKILTPVPPIDEQVEIAKKIKSVNTLIELKLKKVGDLNNTKKALMQDLLTGKVRVNINS